MTTPSQHDVLTHAEAAYDSMCECGLHRVTNVRPQVCIRCGSSRIEVTVLGADSYHELT